MILKMNFNFNFIRIVGATRQRQRTESPEVVICITRRNTALNGCRKMAICSRIGRVNAYKCVLVGRKDRGFTAFGAEDEDDRNPPPARRRRRRCVLWVRDEPEPGGRRKDRLGVAACGEFASRNLSRTAMGSGQVRHSQCLLQNLRTKLLLREQRINEVGRVEGQEISCFLADADVTNGQAEFA